MESGFSTQFRYPSSWRGCLWSWGSSFSLLLSWSFFSHMFRLFQGSRLIISSWIPATSFDSFVLVPFVSRLLIHKLLSGAETGPKSRLVPRHNTFTLYNSSSQLGYNPVLSSTMLFTAALCSALISHSQVWSN